MASSPPPSAYSSQTLRSRLSSPFSPSSSPFYHSVSSRSTLARSFASSSTPSSTAGTAVLPPSDVDEMDSIMARLLWQAGVDEETRPILCVDTSQLPEPKSISYDALLVRIVSTLGLYVEQDYVIVLFAAGSKNSPGWKWIWGAYQRLGRSFRKNLKRLYIVHPSFFTKMLFALASPLISPKFFSKLVYAPTLSFLATHVPIQHLRIPADTLRENLKHEPTVRLPPASLVPSLQFGVGLDTLMGSEEPFTLPRVIQDAVTFLKWEDGAMESEGLFRKSASAGVLRNVGEAYDRGAPVELASYQDPNLAAVLIKKFFRELPSPLFPSTLYHLIGSCPRITQGEHAANEEVVGFLKERLFLQLSLQSVILFGYVIHFLHQTSLFSSSNRMTPTNLAIVFTPNLLNSSHPLDDARLSAVPPAPIINSSSFFPNPPLPPSPAPTTPKKERPTTLGEIIRFAIEFPVEVFGPLGDEDELEGDAPEGEQGEKRKEGVLGKRFWEAPE